MKSPSVSERRVAVVSPLHLETYDIKRIRWSTSDEGAKIALSGCRRVKKLINWGFSVVLEFCSLGSGSLKNIISLHVFWRGVCCACQLDRGCYIGMISKGEQYIQPA